ncbi:MAG: TIGR03986 family CRISPR-associated RAMP protein [Planctomycetes bacterium]|nr:TIGR03986 family CRISPR-associated RAMP protein [Planctomycetota bacterium]
MSEKLIKWRIVGTFTTLTPLHVGSGAVAERAGLVNDRNKDEKTPCDVQAVVKDHRGKPCVPGTTVKGVLRAWAETFFPERPALLVRIFGREDHRDATGESGWAEFGTATYDRHGPFSYAGHVPYWDANALTGVFSNVCLDRHTGAARANKLFFQEFVPEGVTFRVEIRTGRLKPDEVALLLAVLEHGAGHASHPYQFGANGADGWGRVKWDRIAVETRESGTPWVDAAGAAPAELPAPTGGVNHRTIDLTLKFRGPFLVNDASRARADDAPEDNTTPHFVPLRRADGGPWLPASSFRGALRARAEFLLRSADENATGDPNWAVPRELGRIERLFGTTRLASRLTIDEFEVSDPGAPGRQDFVAIDRFTGGAADGALFTAEHVVRPAFKTRLTIDLDGTKDGIKPEDLGLLAAALRDVCTGAVTFGFGGSKGYGEVRGELDPDGEAWLREQIAHAPRAAAPRAPEGPGAAAPAAAVKEGVLVWQGEGKKRKRVLQAPTNKLPYQLNNPKEIVAELSASTAEAIEVDFELEKGQPVRIRPRGEPWPTAALAGAAPRPGQFANPYYFLPLHDRDGFSGELADGPPRGHGRYLPGTYSGTIRVRLTTVTPLLLCDTTNVRTCPDGGDPAFPPGTKKGHKVYPLLLTRDGKPLLASSSVRGMLRAAFEGVTNSRFGVFPSRPGRANTRRLGYRTTAGEGLSVVPVRIENGRARLMLGSNPDLPAFDRRRDRWVVPGGLLHAAWVARYEAGVAGVARWAVTLNGVAPIHGAHGWCWLELVQHTNPPFSFWAVREAAPTERELSLAAPDFIPMAGKYSSLRQVMKASGWFCVTNQNAERKHDERFFFTAPATANRIADVSEPVRRQYHELVCDYQSLHRDALIDRSEKGITPEAYLGDTPGQTAFSRHVYEPDALEVRDGHLCYARVRSVGGADVIEALYPVTISRRLFDKSPLDLLPAKLHPAAATTELSPADRVFGWVSQDADEGTSDPAHRSQVRVGVVECTCASPDPIETFAVPKALAILGEPKPQQGRFYLGKKNDHFAVPQHGASKEQAGYNDTNRVRGPKVYPHHRRFDGASATTDERSNQNRSVEGWVKPGATFEFDLRVTNLSRFELGALAWLLALPAGRHLRLGLGKPLGFGSVRAEIVEDRTRVADGATCAAAIGAWETDLPHLDLAPLVAEFQATLGVNPRLLQAFLRASGGVDGLPVHYPRLASQQSGSGEYFEWFVSNERESTQPGQRGLKRGLPDLTEPDCSLPAAPTH